MNAIRWQSAADFAVLAIAIYLLLRWGREARALRLALFILALRIGALLSRQMDLLITVWVLDATTIVALLVLVVGFQPELRHAVMRLDLTRRPVPERQVPVLAAVAEAASSLAESRCGALIVLVQNDTIGELITGGATVAARVSLELLQAIFQKGSSIHDGAVIVEGDQITRAGAILPLTQRRLPEQYGTRHRAGIGLSDRSDAVVVVVSEERGEVTLMRQGRAQVLPGGDADALTAALRAMTIPESARARKARPRSRATEAGLVAASLALSGLVWSVTFLPAGKSVRVQTVPVEFTNVPPGLMLAGQSTDSLQVWLRGTDFVFGSVNLGGLVVRCDLATAHEGANLIRIEADAFNVPPGIRVEKMTPNQLSVRLTPLSPSS